MSQYSYAAIVLIFLISQGGAHRLRGPSKKKCNGRWLPKLLDYDSLAVSQAEFDSEGFGNHKTKKAEKRL